MIDVHYAHRVAGSFFPYSNPATHKYLPRACHSSPSSYRMCGTRAPELVYRAVFAARMGLVVPLSSSYLYGLVRSTQSELRPTRVELLLVQREMLLFQGYGSTSSSFGSRGRSYVEPEAWEHGEECGPRKAIRQALRLELAGF